jgi:hypothetical protein
MFLKDFTRNALSATRVVPARAMSGLTADTLVETTSGWLRASELRIGQRVHTWDGGAAVILGLDRQPVTHPDGVLIPGGVADTCCDLILPRDQYLLTGTYGDAALPDADMVLVPATAWASQPWVTRTKITGELTTLMFADEEIIWANSGALLHCPSVMAGPGRLPLDGFFMALPDADACALLTRRAERAGF